MMQASKANESVSEYSKTGLCITVNVLRMLAHESHLNVTGVQFFRLPILTELSRGLNLQKCIQAGLKKLSMCTVAIVLILQVVFCCGCFWCFFFRYTNR